MNHSKAPSSHFPSALVAVACALLASRAPAESWTQLSPSGGPPTPRYGHTAVLNGASGRMIIFGGIFGTTGTPALGNDVWIFSDARTNGGNVWQSLTVSGTKPSARGYHSATYDPTNNRMIVFGGDPNVGNCLVDVNDTWVLTNADGTVGTGGWIQLTPSGSPPPARSAASAIFDSANNRMMIYGGNKQCGVTYADFWVLTNANGLGGTPGWTQLSPSGGGPGARTAHFAAYDAAHNRMILFGGGTLSGVTNDTWILSNANGIGGTPAWTQLNPTGPLPLGRNNFTAGYDAAMNTLIVFGGGSSAGNTNDAWLLSNANGLGGTPAWTRLNPSAPLPGVRSFLAGAAIPGANRLVIVDGVYTGIYNDVWALQYTPPAINADLAIGQEVSPNPIMLNSNVTYSIAVTNFGPEAASGVIVSNYLPAQLTFVSAVSSQGSCSFTNSAVTCNLGSLASNAPLPAITNQPINQSVSLGNMVTLTAGASGYSPLYYQWQLDGTNLPGATGSSLVLTNVTLAEAGIYSVTVTNAEGTVTSATAILTLVNLRLYPGLTIAGPTGVTYRVDYFADVGDTNTYANLTNFVLPTSPYLFIDTQHPAVDKGFYRAAPVP
jgi:uncharacterized repeat protein (TIGR01451 family)